MATPNADRLKIIEVWKTDPIEQANDDLRDVSARMRRVAEINRRVAADLGLEGETAQAASARLDGLATSLESRAQKVDKLAEIQGKAVESGRKAQTGSLEIQKTLQSVNEITGRAKSMGAANANTPIAPNAQAERDAVHAAADRRAKKVLHVLGSEMHELIGSLPDQPEHAPSSGQHGVPPDSPKAERGIGKGSGQAGSPGGGSPGYQGPTRSATEWYTPKNIGAGGSGSSVGGGYGPGGGDSGGMTMQGSHYAPGQAGAFAPGGSRTLNPTTAPPAVFSPLATAAAIGGGTAVAGYKAYQAVRAARAAATPSWAALPARSGAAVRATVPSSSGILRGATTAARATSSQTGSRGMPVRGGATGVARPVSASSSARSSGIVRGATTAVRASSPASSSRGSGILRGATTAARTPTSSPDSAGKAGSYGARSANGVSNRAAQSSTRGMGASASRGAGATSRTATASRGAGSSATRSGASRLAAGRSVERSSAEGRSSSSSRALSGLTGRGEANREKDKQRKQRREKPVKPKSVSAYETDKKITFLEAGCRKESD